MGYPIVFSNKAAVISEKGLVYIVDTNTGQNEPIGNTGIDNARDIHHYEGNVWFFLSSRFVYTWNEASGPLNPGNISIVFEHRARDAQGLTYDYVLNRFVISTDNRIITYNANGSIALTVVD